MESKPKILWVGDLPIPDNLRKAAGDDCQLSAYRPDEPLGPQLIEAELAVVRPNGAAESPDTLAALLAEFETASAVGVFLLPPEAIDAWRQVADHPEAVLWIRPDAAPNELAAKLDAAAALQPTIRSLKSALVTERREGRRLEVLDEEMRLASRLQRDFLPRHLPEVGPARFSISFHPVSHVSGDIYDVVRLDETHLGFYVADAVGHGMPAALLTMFIKKALQTKRIFDSTYEIVSPEVSLAGLNASICQQNLSTCQFCTAVYCVLDTSDLVLTYARAGHPEPVLLRADGRVETLAAEGSLLGVFEEARFELASIRLARGDRLVLYTDGAEPCSRPNPMDAHRELLEFLTSLAGLGPEATSRRLAQWVDHVRRTAREQDDITLLLLDL